MGRSTYPEHITRWMTTYLTGHLCGALGIPPVFDEIALPDYGLKSYVLLVHPHDQPPFILRCMVNPAEAQALRANMRLCGEHGLPTPAVRFEDISRDHFREHGFGVIVENLIEGKHLNAGTLSESQLAHLAEMFARLHRIESAQWGSPHDLSTRSYFDYVIVSKINNRLKTIAKFDEDFQSKWRDEIMKFIKSFRKGFDGLPPFSLTHDKINCGNVIFGAGEQSFVVDLESLCFGSPGKDITAAMYYFCKSPDEIATFKQKYFAEVGGRIQRHYEKHERLYRVWHHLSRWGNKSHNIYKRKKAGKDDPSLFYPTRAQEREALWVWVNADAA